MVHTKFQSGIDILTSSNTLKENVNMKTETIKWDKANLFKMHDRLLICFEVKRRTM